MMGLFQADGPAHGLGHQPAVPEDLFPSFPRSCVGTPWPATLLRRDPVVWYRMLPPRGAGRRRRGGGNYGVPTPERGNEGEGPAGRLRHISDYPGYE